MDLFHDIYRYLYRLQIQLPDGTMIAINKYGVFKVNEETKAAIKVSIPNVVNGVVLKKSGAFIIVDVAGNYFLLILKKRVSHLLYNSF